MKRHGLSLLLQRERPHLVLAVRGTLAALAALAVAALLKLECPFWAAMTALIVIQPTRGLLLEKSYYRLLGTAVGSLGGLAMLLTSRSPAMLALMLSLWLAACVGAGNLVYGLRSYGAMIAGCTCAVVAMAGYNNPPHLHDLVFGRIACIVVGIVVSTTVTFFFTQRGAKRELLDRLRRVTAAEVRWLAMLLGGADENDLHGSRQDILMEIAAIEGSLDAAWAGSLELKRRKRHIRSLIVAQLSLLEAGTLTANALSCQHRSDNGSWQEPLAKKLEAVAEQLNEHGAAMPATADLVDYVAAMPARLPLLRETLLDLIGALQLVVAEWDKTAPETDRPAVQTYIRHRDWQEGGRAALRAACAMAAVGTAWSLTGWAEGSSMIMAASIMVSVFSTHDRPTVMLSHIFCGASMGVAAAFVFRLLLLPGPSGLLPQAAFAAPVLIIGLVAFRHRRTALGAMDFMLFFLFVMQPGIPAVPSPVSYLAGGLACLGGVAVAILAFKFLLPIDPARRLRTILVAIAHDLDTMAATDSPIVMEKCRARTHHRVLRLLVNAGKLDHVIGAVMDGALTALVIARYLHLRKADVSGGASDADMKTIREIKDMFSAVVGHPERVIPTLEEISELLDQATEVQQFSQLDRQFVGLPIG
ncbi:FUSC family protein [Geotalea sp. SG265]|uniref:FUSC family protein n=1 Tax=Geotalea sp. SG265 TaxID=2922867 RepID=UPI001FB022A2|nr:FUSC family protein [Geotalea sp. SG265]